MFSRKSSVTHPPPATTIFVQTPTGPVRAVELNAACTAEEVRGVLLGILGVCDHPALLLSRADGTILPIGAHIPANRESEPYIVSSETLAELGSSRPHHQQQRRNTVNGAMMGTTASLAAPVSLGPVGSSATIGGSDTLSTIADQIKELPHMREQLDAVQKMLLTSPTARRHIQFPEPRTVSSPTVRMPPAATLNAAYIVDPDAPPKYKLSDKTIAHLKQVTFNNWEWEECEMTTMMEHMFAELGLIQHFSIELPTLRRFLLAVKENYNKNPFHNFQHSFCVSQMFYGMLYSLDVVSKLEPIDKLIALVSCIVHDIDHPGCNNAYQINAKTQIAHIYNDQSPLENHHCAFGFTVLKMPQFNIVKNLSPSDALLFRKGVIRCVLATDLAKHGELMNQFKTYAESFDWQNAEHRSLLLVMLVKCADLSNEARPTNVAEPWLDCLLEEQFAQADREKAEGLPVAPFMDREKVTRSGSQLGFIPFVMSPLYETLARVVPTIQSTILPQIQKSLEHYQAMQQKEKELKAGAGAVPA